MWNYVSTDILLAKLTGLCFGVIMLSLHRFLFACFLFCHDKTSLQPLPQMLDSEMFHIRMHFLVPMLQLAMIFDNVTVLQNFSYGARFMKKLYFIKSAIVHAIITSFARKLGRNTLKYIKLTLRFKQHPLYFLIRHLLKIRIKLLQSVE